MENQDAFNAWYDNEVYSGREPGRCLGPCYTIQSIQPERVAALEEMLKRNNLITTIEPAEAHCIIPGWISVEDRLPKDDESGLEFICMTSATGRCNGVMALDWEVTTVRGRTVRRWLWRGRICPWNVTHWMKEPGPPRDGG